MTMHQQHSPPIDSNKDPLPEDAQDPVAVPMPVEGYRVSLVILAVLAVIFALHWAQAVFIPLILAAILSYTLSAPVKLLQGWHIPRAIGAALMMFSVFGAMGYAAYMLKGDAAEIVETLPKAAEKLRLRLLEGQGTSEGAMEKVQRAATQLEHAASETGAAEPDAPLGVTRVQIEKPKVNIKDYLWTGTKGAMTFAGQLGIVLVLSYFILVSGDNFRLKMIRIAGPSLSSKKLTLHVLDDITGQIQRYLLVQLFTSILVGVATWLAFRWLGVEHAAIWGIVAGVLKTIPYLGPLIVSAGALVIAFLQFGTFGMALLVSGVALLITSIEGYLLTPWLIGRASRMSPVVVFSSVLFWGWLWGLWGLLLGVPIIMTIKVVCDRVEGLRPLGELLGE